MPTVHKEHGCRFVIYLNDHPPPHVHVLGDGHAKLLLKENEPVELDEADGFTFSKLRSILETVEKQKAALLDAWQKIHG